MPFSEELGMRIYDPREGQQYGLNLAQEMGQAFEKGYSIADKARQILKRNMAVEAMKIRAAELYSHMEQTPENQNLAQRQAFFGERSGYLG